MTNEYTSIADAIASGFEPAEGVGRALSRFVASMRPWR